MAASTQSVELARLFRRGFAATFGLDLVTSALGAVTVVILIRGLSVSHYAYTTLFLTFGQFAGAAASGGTRTRYLRERAERVSRTHTTRADADFGEALLKGTLAIAVIGLVGLPIGALVGFGSGFAGAGLILGATSFAIGYAATELVVAHYQAQTQFLTAGMFRVGRAVVLLLAAVGIVITSESTLSISVWYVVAVVGVGVVAVAPLALTRGSSRTSRISRFGGEELWLSFYYLASAGFAYVDVLVAGSLLGKHDVASLGASLRYLAIVLAAIPALGAILRVRTAQVDVVDSPANQDAMVIGWLRRAALPATVVTTISIVLAPFVIPVIDGGRYPSSIPTLQIFLVTALTAYLSAPVANVLMAQRHYATLAAIYAVGLTLNLIGDIAVARTYGIVGIAIVSTAVYVCIDAAMGIAAVRYARGASR